MLRLPMVACSFVALLGTGAEAAPYRFAVTWGSIPILDGEVTLEDGPAGFAIAGSGRTVGPAALLFDWEGAARSQGVVEATGPRALRHESTGRVGTEVRRTVVEWPAGGGVPSVRAEPPPDPEDTVPVPEGTTAGTVDPFSGLLRVLERVERSGRCEGTERIFDGRRRYDVTIQDLGTEQVAADGTGAYAGPARRCRLLYQWIGGHGRDWSGVRAADQPRRDVWVARVGEGAWLPVRVEAATRLGTVVGRLLLR